eukprot:m.212822 g.212822  ORF g.212822 m.212822 type:complete len:123 (+) comp26163_c0_seq1:100-468(+)
MAAPMIIVLTLGLIFVVASVSAAETKNVLFLVVDDMRPSIGAYNFSMAHTPNMDAFAERSLLFQRAYVQYSFCAPSRNSFMTGYRPGASCSSLPPFSSSRFSRAYLFLYRYDSLLGIRGSFP